MKRTFFLLCAVLLVAGSLLPLAGYRLATAALGRAAPEAAESAPEPAASEPAALPEAAAPPSDQDSESFLIRDLSNGAVAAVPRREYLIGAVAAEMPITWPDEALKAQAIAAHSYALYCREEYNMLCSIERLAPGIFAEEKGSTKPVCANVDLFSGLIYNMLGISEDLYTPLFAIARVPGWCAHRVEEVVFANRIIRPAYKYLGVRQKYKPIEER